MREQYPLRSRQNMLRFPLPANLEKCLCRFGHHVRNFKAVFAGRLKELLGDLRSRNTVALFRGHELLGTLQASKESIADSKGQRLPLCGLLELLRFFGHRVLLLVSSVRCNPFVERCILTICLQTSYDVVDRMSSGK